MRRVTRDAIRCTLTWLRGQCQLSKWFWLQRDVASMSGRV